MNSLDQQLDAMLPQWAQLVSELKPAAGFWITRFDEPIDETVYPTEEAAWEAVEQSSKADGVAPVTLCLTVGFTPESEDRNASWHYQTGDNSFTGGAYGHPHWAVVWLSAESVPAEVAEEIANQIADLVCS